MKIVDNNKDTVQMILSNSKTSLIYSEWINYNLRYFSNGVSNIHHPIISAEVLDSSRMLRRLMMLYKTF